MLHLLDEDNFFDYYGACVVGRYQPRLGGKADKLVLVCFCPTCSFAVGQAQQASVSQSCETTHGETGAKDEHNAPRLQGREQTKASNRGCGEL